MAQEHPCARCARVQKTCCQRAEIVVTTGDVARIAAHLGLVHSVAVPRPSGLGPMVVPSNPSPPTHNLAPSGKVVAQDTGSFWHRTRPTHADYFEPDADDPNWVRYTIALDKTRRVLRKQDGHTPGLSAHRGQAGDCTFLGPAGCSLPEEVRPLVCRLYPFMYTERGLDGAADESEGVDESYCPTHLFFTPRERRPTDGRPRVTMLTVLRMDPIAAERWRRQLYDELRADHDARS